jgi:hypothetical protein
MTKLKLLLISLFSSAALFAQVTKQGNDTLLDIGCWNIEWFGDASNGPQNELLQYNNVKSILTNTDIDVWGLSEVSSLSSYMSLVDDLEVYDEILASYSQTQKTALLWKKEMFDLVSWQMILNTSQYSIDFAYRPPLEVVLRTKNIPVIDTIYFYVVHLKAFSDQDSYNRRKNASVHLKTFLDANRSNKKVTVIGDWNDNVTFPTWSGATESPFKNFVDDTANYFFTSKLLSDLGKKSYARSYGTMIDHQLISNELFTFYVDSSAKVLDNLPQQISGYVDSTSDHYPVLSFFNLKRQDTINTSLFEQFALHAITVYPNPVKEQFYIETKQPINRVTLSDMQGRTLHAEIFYEQIGKYRLVIPTEIRNGIYLLEVKLVDGNSIVDKLMISK